MKTLCRKYENLMKTFFSIENIVLSLPGNSKYEVICAIWYQLHNLKNLKNTNEGVSLLVKWQASACNFTEINTPPWVFFSFLNCTNGADLVPNGTKLTLYSRYLHYLVLIMMLRSIVMMYARPL